MEHKDYRLAAILFTDIVGFSRMMEKDEAGTLRLMEFHDTLIRGHVGSAGGNIVKTIGDAFLIEFSNANNAIRSAIAIQNDLEKFNASNPPVPLILRIGCHLGDIYFYENDALGEGINIASRLQSLASPGRVVMSQEVYNLVQNKIDIPVRALGVVNLKNITRELRAYEVMTNGSGLAQNQSENDTANTNSFSTSDAGTQGAHVDSTASDSYQQIRHKIFSAIKRAGRRLSRHEARIEAQLSGDLVDQVLDVMVSQGFLAKDDRPGTKRSSSNLSQTSSESSNRGSSDGIDYMVLKTDLKKVGSVIGEIAREIKSEVSDAIKTSRKSKRPAFGTEEYLAKQENQLASEQKKFNGHLSSYVTVNLGLWFIWFMTSPGNFVWPLIVSLAWGIGMFTHFFKIREKKDEIERQKQLPILTERQLNTLAELFKERRAWTSHWTSNLATSVFLVVLNFMVSPFFPWAAFPVIGMGLGLFGHRAAYRQKEKKLLEQLNAEGLPMEALSGKRKLNISEPQGAIDSNIKEAERLRERIVRQFKSLKGRHPLGDDFLPVLENYITQIKELSQRSREIDLLLAGMPVAELRRERDQIATRRADSTNERINAEYDRSLKQFEKQLSSHKEMQEEQLVLRQRLYNSIQSLRQLELDVSRIKTVSAGSGFANTDLLKNHSDELRQYLEDLQQGYKEVEDSLSMGTIANKEDI